MPGYQRYAQGVFTMGLRRVCRALALCPSLWEWADAPHRHIEPHCRYLLGAKESFLRTNFSSSKLVRLLGDPASVGKAGASVDSAEQLSVLLGVFDAVTLRGALQAIQTTRAAAQPAGKPVQAGRSVGVAAQVQQVRQVLVHAITTKPVAVADAGASRRRGRNPEPLPLPVPAVPEEAVADYAVFRQRHQDLQRQMDLMLPPLRVNVREAIAAVSPTLRQLAALDAVWEQMLAVREQKLLATIPTLLKHRFEQLRTTHPQQDEPALWRQAGGWLDRFDKEQQAVMLAELDLRLEPVMGLVEAFQRETALERAPTAAPHRDIEKVENAV
jgi:hypothetical protein